MKIKFEIDVPEELFFKVASEFKSKKPFSLFELIGENKFYARRLEYNTIGTPHAHGYVDLIADEKIKIES